MLDKIDNQIMDKKTYKNEITELEKKLASLEKSIVNLKIPVIIVFDGWSAAGKGTLISKVLYPLDPRCFNVYTMNKVTEDMIMRPYLTQFWTKTPSKGRITIFDKSWHRIVLPEGSKKWKLTETELAGFYNDVNAFEKQLYDDGNLIIKFFLQISKEEQRKRIKELEKNPDTRWRVNQGDWDQNKNYDKYLSLFENMIQQTNVGASRWSVIESDDKKYAVIKTFKILIHTIEEEIQRRALGQTAQTCTPSPEPPQISILSSVNPNKMISDEEYKKKLDHYQREISDLGYKLYTKRRSVIIVYEGWDAAGKGGNIKRLTEELDPRGYEVVPIAAPTQEELSHHYLWRFYKKLPKDGHIAIFDRSWYGRVMVERIEQYCGVAEWQRAYDEINSMERHLVNHGTILLKFWLHIDKDEQLARFEARQADPLKQYKITDEDWRNREKWDAYEKAVDEMLFRTSTGYAPWMIVESNYKKHARIKVLESVVKELRKKLR